MHANNKRTVLYIITFLLLLFNAVPTLAATKTIQLKPGRKVTRYIFKGETAILLSDPDLTWTSTKPSVAAVTKEGKVKAIRTGRTLIKGEKFGSWCACNLVVESPSISEKTLKMETGDIRVLEIAGTEQKVKWRSANTKVAAVDSGGYVTAKGAGTAVITAFVGDRTYTCKVTVTDWGVPEPEPEPVSADLEVHFIDAGQGDSVLISSAGEAMLIDAGGPFKGAAVQSYLRKQGITYLKYVIATHPDRDHIGGMPYIIRNFKIGKYFAPDTSDDDGFLEDSGITPVVPKTGRTYNIGAGTFTIVSTGNAYDTANDSSICIRLVHGKRSFLFTGDAEQQAELDMMAGKRTLRSDVYMLANHGGRTSSSSAFLDAVKPKYVVISCGRDNAEGYPHVDTLNRLLLRNIRVFRTDEQKTIIAASDGQNIKWSDTPSNSWKAGKEPDLSA